MRLERRQMGQQSLEEVKNLEAEQWRHLVVDTGAAVAGAKRRESGQRIRRRPEVHNPGSESTLQQRDDD